VAVAPGNGGTAALGANVELDLADPAAIAEHATERGYGLVVVGPEAPLAAGVADSLARRRVPVLGPTREAARLEWSKAFAKRIMERAGVPTPRALAFHDADEAAAAIHAAARDGRRVVVKADWLAAGKGVTVGETPDDDVAGVRRLFDSAAGRRRGAVVLLEDRLRGREVSLLALVCGERVVPLPPARDYKRLADGDEGPNTGGMGAYAPVPWFDRTACEAAMERVLEPVAWRMARDGTPYRGVLYAGLIETDEGLRVLEFNARLGDPEAQAILPLVGGDLAMALLACAEARPADMEASLAATPAAAVAVVLAADGYPDSPRAGARLEGAEPSIAADDGPALCFHGGTRAADGGWVATGGRVATFVGLSRDGDLAAARRIAYEALESARLEGGRHRSDVAAEVER
jgi:phosphoribosylamine--glycine ligase